MGKASRRKPAGIPKGTDDNPVFWCRLTSDERKGLEVAANAKGVELVEYCRSILVGAPVSTPAKKSRGACTFQMGDKAAFVIHTELTKDEARRFLAAATISAEGMTEESKLDHTPAASPDR